MQNAGLFTICIFIYKIYAPNRQKSIEQLLEEKIKIKPTANQEKHEKVLRPGTNHRTKTINLGLEKQPISASKPKIMVTEMAKSRNAASRAQDRKTYEAKLPGSDKKEDHFLYQTTAEPPHPAEKKTLSKPRVMKDKNVKKINEHAVSIIHTNTIGQNNDKYRKLKVSLVGVETATGYSRNGNPAKTSVKELPKDSKLIKKSSGYGGSKRAYVASLLQPSASMKK